MKNKRYLFYALFAFTYLGLGAYYPYLALYLKNTLGYNGREVSAIASIAPLLGMFLIPMWGVLTDVSKKPRLVLGIAYIGTALSLYFYAGIKSFYVLLGVVLIYNIFQRALMPLVDNIGVNYAKDSGNKYSVMRSFGSFGFIVGSFVGGWFLARFTDEVFLYVFLGSVLVALFVLLFIPHLKIEDGPRVHLKSDLPKLISNKKYLKVVAAYSIIIGVLDSAFTYNGLRLEELNFNLEYMGLTVLLMVIPEVLLMIKVDDLLKKYTHKQVLLLASGLLMLRMLFISLVPSLWLYVVLIMFHGIVIALTIPTSVEYIKMITPRNLSATAITFAGLTSSVMVSIIIFISGFMIDFFGLSSIYYFYSFLGLLSLIILMMTRGRLKK